MSLISYVVYNLVDPTRVLAAAATPLVGVGLEVMHPAGNSQPVMGIVAALVGLRTRGEGVSPVAASGNGVVVGSAEMQAEVGQFLSREFTWK